MILTQAPGLPAVTANGRSRHEDGKLTLRVSERSAGPTKLTDDVGEQ